MDVQAGDLKTQVGNIIKTLTATYKFHSFPGYRALLSLYGVGVEKIEGDNKGHRYTGLVYSALDGDGNRVGAPLKSSLFGKPYGIESLERLMTKSGDALKTKGLPTGIHTTVAASLANSNTDGEFRADLRAKGIDLILRYGNGGRLFGATFIDHNSRTVLNGSALGKDFAANALAERFSDLATENKENKRVVPAATTPTDETSRQTVWPTQGDRETTIHQEYDNVDRSPDNTDNQITIPDLSPIGDAAGSIFSILTPAPGGQTTDNRPVRRPQPKKKKRGQSV